MTFDLQDDNAHFVLTEALKEFAARQRSEAEDGDPNAESRLEWAVVADAMLELTEASM